MRKARLKLKVCLVGERAVGKTSLVRRYVLDEFDDRYIRTLGTKVSKKKMKVVRPDEDTEYTIYMTIWDIMGEKCFTDLLQEAFFYGAKGVIAVCDLTRKKTLNELKEWIDGVYGVTGEIPVTFFGNKRDLRSRIQLKKADVNKLSKKYGSRNYFTSAKTGENVEKAFMCLAEDMVDAKNK